MFVITHYDNVRLYTHCFLYFIPLKADLVQSKGQATVVND